MAVKGICGHEDCNGWCVRKVHTLYGRENYETVSEVLGNLFTLSGQRFPEEVSPEIRSRVNVPPHFSHLCRREVEPVAEVEIDFDTISELDGLGEDIDDLFETKIGRGITQVRPRQTSAPQMIGRRQ